MKTLAFDTETTPGGELFACCTSTLEGHVKIYRGKGLRESVKRLLDGETRLIMHNAKFDLGVVSRYLGRRIWKEVPFDDTIMLSRIFRNDHYSHALEDLCYDEFGFDRIDKRIRKLGKDYGGYDKIPRPEMDRYQIADGKRTALLWRWLWPIVSGNRKWLDCYQVELEMIKCALDMEEVGVTLSIANTKDLIRRLERRVKRNKKKIESWTWDGFNPRSVVDKRELLYERWKVKTKRRTKKGFPVTDKHILLSVREQKERKKNVDDLLRVTSHQQGLTILNSYLKVADRNGIIHPNINTCAAVTARQSCSRPNLQNVAKESVLLNRFPVPARRCFIPREGYVNLHADFAGIELRLLVHYSGDPEMVKCLKKEEDPHALAAETFFKRFSGENNLRGAAKNANFALCYGAGADKIAQVLGLCPEEGKTAFERYRRRFPALAGLSRKIADQVFRRGYVQSVFGRRFHVARHEAYVGVNYLIQGTAADILKRAQLRVHKENEKWGARLIMTIHDEVIVELPLEMLDRLEEYLKVTRKLMIKFPQFSVPLEVEFALARENWSEKVSVDFVL
jgi:DNA polymerase-1